MFGILIMKKGITLLEMMIALLISLGTLSVLMSVYVSARKNFRMQQSLSNLQNNARTAIELLQSDLQIAGFIGCSRLTDENSFELNAKNKIELKDNSITVRHAEVQNGNVIEDMINTINIIVSLNPTFLPNDSLIISDCSSSEVVHVKEVFLRGASQLLIAQLPLSKAYGKYAEISKLIKNTYFIDKTKRLTIDGKPIFALFKLDIQGKKVERVEGINSMKVNWIGNESDPKGISIELQLFSDSFIKTWYTQIRLR